MKMQRAAAPPLLDAEIALVLPFEGLPKCKWMAKDRRAGILDALEDSYDYGNMVLSDLDNQNATDTVTALHGERTTRASAALQAFDGPMDYYGNLVVYLRLNGIVPPDTHENVEDVAPPVGRPLIFNSQ